MVLYTAFFLFSALVAALILFAAVSFDGTQLFMLPSFFVLWLLFSKSLFLYYRKSIVFKVFLITALARYVLIPFFYYFQSSYMSLSGTSTEIYLSIIIMGVELLLCGLCFSFFSKQQKRSLSNEKKVSLFLDNKITVLLILSLIGFYLLGTGVFNKINFVWALNDYAQKTTEGDIGEVAGYGDILFLIFRVVIVLLLVTIIYKAKIASSIKPYLYLLVVVSASVVIIGLSRFSMLLFALPILILINKLIPEKQIDKIKKLNIYLLILLMFFITLSTIAKFSRYDTEFHWSNIVTTSTLNAYFTGVGGISAGISNAEASPLHESPLFILHDMIRNVPILSKLSSDRFSTSAAYNKDVLGHDLWADKIVPLSVTGVYHFGVFGVGLYHVLFLSLALYFERLSCKQHYIGYKFLCIDLSIKLSLIFMLNIGSFYSGFSRSLLFVFLPLFLIRTIRLRTGRLT